MLVQGLPVVGGAIPRMTFWPVQHGVMLWYIAVREREMREAWSSSLSENPLVLYGYYELATVFV